MGATVRQAPEWFVRELNRRFGAGHEVRYNEAVCRWEIISPSATGRPCSQFWGWFQNPLTGERIEPDGDTGLVPFRDLDQVACHEILRNMEKTFLGNPWDGSRDWKEHAAKATRFNRELREKSIRQRSIDFANLLKEVDLRRPWVKHHTVLSHQQRQERARAQEIADNRARFFREVGIAA